MVFVGCHKEPIELSQLGSITLELTKGYKVSNNNSKGAFESFWAVVSVMYENGDSVAYNCLFTDTDDSGVYTNDIVEGDRIFISRGSGFRLSVSAFIDGYNVYGDSGPNYIYFSDNDEDNNWKIEIELLSGKSRLGIYQPKEDEIFGNFVIANGELVEVENNALVEECGFMCVPESVYASLQSSADFTFESRSLDYDRLISDIDTSFNRESPKGKISVMLSGLSPNTKYYMRAFAMTRSDSSAYIYSRVIDFTTTDQVSSDLVLVPNSNQFDISYNRAEIFAYVKMQNDSPVSDVEYGGICVMLNEESGTPDINNSMVYYGNIEGDGTQGTMLIEVNDLAEGTTYKFRLFARYAGIMYYSTESVFRTTFNPENMEVSTVDPTDEIIATSTVTLYGDLLNDAGCTITEVGFMYGYRSLDNSNEMTLSDLVYSKTGTMTDGRFSAQVSMPIDRMEFYYVAYVMESTMGYTQYGEIKHFTVSPTDIPEIRTSAPSSMTTYSAKIPCSVETYGRTCECGIIYMMGEDTASLDYNNTSIGYLKASAGYVSGTFNVNLRGLMHGERYAYKAYVNTGNGIVQSEQRYFTLLDIGDNGPGGGEIFYCGSDFALEYVDFEREEDGSDLVGEYVAMPWGAAGGLAITTESPSTGIVSGKTNTESIVTFNNSHGEYGELEYAAGYCVANNFYLPSTSEVYALIDYLNNPPFFKHGRSRVRGVSEGGTFWTSEETDENTAVCIEVVSDDTLTATQRSDTKTNSHDFFGINRF